jgi:hypothetical protein
MTTKIITNISNLPVDFVFNVGANSARKTSLLRKHKPNCERTFLRKADSRYEIRRRI